MPPTVSLIRDCQKDENAALRRHTTMEIKNFATIASQERTIGICNWALIFAVDLRVGTLGDLIFWNVDGQCYGFSDFALLDSSFLRQSTHLLSEITQNIQNSISARNLVSHN
jgi:hypothetical protein